MEHHEPGHRRRIKMLSEGELLVTGRGEIVIEEPLRRSRALFVHSEDVIEVRFSEDAAPCPPCNPDEPDELDWEVFEHHHGSDLYLKIFWHVSCARGVKWEIFEVE